MKILGVIPSRYDSTRFEGKPLKEIMGYPMIEWVYKRSEQSNIDELVVATDDERIFEAVKKFGGNVIMTSKDHENGTSRIVEVIENEKYKNFDFIINIQGDEPLIDIHSINLLADNYRKERSEIITLKKELKNIEEIESPNIVKVITDFDNNALYFSRSVIPYNRDNKIEFKYFKHIGIYGYTSDFLRKLTKLYPEFLMKKSSANLSLPNCFNILLKIVVSRFKLGISGKEPFSIIYLIALSI